MSRPTEAVIALLSGTLGPACIDIGTLYKDTGHFTYDPGYGSTASTKSAITYIDGDEGVLLYRGYPISSWPRSPTSLRCLTCCSWRTAEQAGIQRVRAPDHASHDDAS